MTWARIDPGVVAVKPEPHHTPFSFCNTVTFPLVADDRVAYAIARCGYAPLVRQIAENPADTSPVVPVSVGPVAPAVGLRGVNVLTEPHYVDPTSVRFLAR